MAQKTIDFENDILRPIGSLKGDLVSCIGHKTEYDLVWIDNEYVDGNTGNIISYNGWKRTDYTELINNDILYVSTTQSSDNTYNAFYDENKNYLLGLYISGNSNKRPIDYVPKNAKYFIMSCSNTVNMSAYPKTYSTDGLNLKINSINERLDYLESDGLPSYYDSHMKEKNNKVNNIMDGINNCVSFIFFTDQHVYSNARKSGYMMKNILKNTSVKDIINGGDVISAYDSESALVYDCGVFNKYWGFLDMYYVRGNHDIYAKEQEDSTVGFIKPNSMVINRFMRPFMKDMIIENGKTYYYFDRPQNKVRFICIDTNEIITEDTSGSKWEPSFAITQTQINWFINLLNNTPNGYKIVLLGHSPITSNLMWSSEFAQIFGDIVEAFNNKITINKTDSFGIIANGDFTSSNGKIILSIGGHGHVDQAYTSNSGCVYYEVNCDCLLNNGGSEYSRTRDTITEQSFDVVIIDADNGNIKTVRYGAGIDKTLILH